MLGRCPGIVHSNCYHGGPVPPARRSAGRDLRQSKARAALNGVRHGLCGRTSVLLPAGKLPDPAEAEVAKTAAFQALSTLLHYRGRIEREHRAAMQALESLRQRRLARPDEDPAEFHRHEALWLAAWRPRDLHEHAAAEAAIRCMWREERADRLEAVVLSDLFAARNSRSLLSAVSERSAARYTSLPRAVGTSRTMVSSSSHA